MSTQAGPALRVGVVVVAPVVWLAALSYHPYLPGRQPDLEALAEAVESDPTRWGAAHLATGAASAGLILAFLAIRAHLLEASEDHWSAAALPFIVMGSTLYAMLPAMEFAPLVAVGTGSDVPAAQEALLPWFIPLLVAGGVTFALGAFGFAVAVFRSRLLGPGLARVVAAALVVMALSRFVPLSAVQFYLQGVAGLVALLPLARNMRKHPRAALPATPLQSQTT